ncbi:MAG: YicC/YloC family endoribonuclease [Fusicatenibacter sp.]|nr:YicC/YloC family endoribonuclease [Fusicatenibacter sp.]
MIKSMTGFGRAEMSNSDRRITVEIKSVNHRYLDFNVKLPKKLSCFEAAIRGVLKEYIQRGKVDIFITYEDFTDSNVQLKYNRLLAGQYLEYFRQMEEEFSIENDVKVSMLSRCPDVLTMEEMTVDETELWTELEQVLRKAAVQFTEARDREGQALLSDLLGKLDGMRKGVEEIEKREPEILKEYRERLMERTRELLADVQLDEARIASEVVLFADKICTDEETVRLRSHIDNMKSVLLLGGSIGRKLDFIAQEMNREANTILSKANDLDTSNIAIELKTEIEKVREQIQNIE